MAVGDLNGDGLPDVVVGNMVNEFDGYVSVLLNSWDFPGQTYTVDQPTQLAFMQQPGGTVAGSAVNGEAGVSVAVEDCVGGTVGVDSSAVTLTLSGGTFAGGGNTATAAAIAGVATFSNLMIDAAGSYTLTASDGALTGTTSGSFTVSPAAAAELAFTQQPADAMVGRPLSPAVTVTVQDAFGNTVTTDTSSVTIALGGGTFSSGGNTVTVAAVNGVATFSSLAIGATRQLHAGCQRRQPGGRYLLRF